nr:nuclear cap-binding protein subunit 2 [Cryptomonas paramecium]
MEISLYSRINYIHIKKIFHIYHKKFFVKWNIIYIENLIYDWNKNFISLKSCKIKKIVIGVNKRIKTQSNFFFLEFYNFKKTKFAYKLLTGCRFKKTFKIDFEKNFSSKKQIKNFFNQS